MSKIVFDEPANVVITKKKKVRPASSLERMLIQAKLAKSATGARVIIIFFLFVSVVSTILILSTQTSPGNAYGNYDEFIKQHPELSF